TMASMMPDPGHLRAINQLFRDKPFQNSVLANPPALSTLPMMPFLMVSQTAGTPIMIVGASSRMSPLQLRTLTSEIVFGEP
ncbi:hypothetical protein KEM55_001888, partial [Ascosphaera atra]